MLIACLLSISKAHAQNLVMNPSFEDYIVPDEGFYETYPSLIDRWNGYRYMSRHGGCFFYMPPVYRNKQLSSEHLGNEVGNNGTTLCEIGDSSYVIFSPLDFWGNADYICGELECCTQSGTEYELSFDYEVIKNMSDFSLRYIYCAFSGDYGYVTTSKGVRWFHYDNPPTIDLVKVELRTDTLGRHRAHARFISKGGAGYITIGYLPDLTAMDRMTNSIQQLAGHVRSQNLNGIELPIPVEYYGLDDRGRIDKTELMSFRTQYLIDNVCLTPVDSTIDMSHVTSTDIERRQMNVNDEIESDIIRQIHHFSLDGPTYTIKSYDNKETIESDTLSFGSDLYFSKFGFEESLDVDDTIQFVVLSRTLRRGFNEPSCYSIDDDYLRICLLDADGQHVFRLSDNVLTVKESDGKFLHMPSTLLTDTIFILSDKETRHISRLFDKNYLTELGKMCHYSDSLLARLTGVVLDYKRCGEKSVVVIDESYLHGSTLKHTRYGKIYEALEYLMGLSRRKTHSAGAVLDDDGC